jgi:hypothetical protein
MGRVMEKVVKQPKMGRPAVYDSPRTAIASRLQAPLHQRIKDDADAAGRSISEEIERRLTKSYADEQASGDAEMQRVGAMITSIFWFAGQRAAAAKGEPKWKPADWLQDQDCYRAGIVKVIEALIEGLPNPTPDEKSLTIEQIEARVAANDRWRSGQPDEEISDGGNDHPRMGM